MAYPPCPTTLLTGRVGTHTLMLKWADLVIPIRRCKTRCVFTRKKGTVDAAMLVAEFAGRQIDGHKIDAARVHRYIRYALNNGQFKIAK